MMSLLQTEKDRNSPIGMPKEKAERERVTDQMLFLPEFMREEEKMMDTKSTYEITAFDMTTEGFQHVAEQHKIRNPPNYRDTHVKATPKLHTTMKSLSWT